MGHQRLGTLPRTRRWEQVIALVGGGCPASDVAAAAMEATQEDLARHANDFGLLRSLWLLLQVPIAARQQDFASALRELGIEVSGSNPSVAELAAAFAQTVDKSVEAMRARTELGEMAEMAAVETLVDAATERSPGLFGTPPDVTQRELAGKATDAQFAHLARDFFARFMERFLGYYVGREVPLNVGMEASFEGIRAQREFNEALSLHCREASRIVEKFAGAWYSKARSEGDLSEERTGRFVAYSLKKIRDELMMGATS